MKWEAGHIGVVETSEDAASRRYGSAMSVSAEDVPEDFGLRRVHTLFLDAMEAIRELAAFAEANARHLDDEDAAIRSIASRHLPALQADQHAAAAAVARSAFDRIENALVEAEQAAGEKLDPEAVKTVYGRTFSELQREITEHVGDPAAFVYYLSAVAQAKGRPPRLEILYASLLITAVSNFEVLVAGSIREFLRTKPEAMRASEATYTLAEIEGFETLAEFREYCRERYAEGILRGSFEDWMAWFGKSLKIRLEDITDQPFVLREVFQRRHLFVHNGGEVNRLYLLKLPELGEPPSIGSTLKVSAAYLAQAVDGLVAAGTLLVAFTMKKLVRSADPKHPADELVDTTAYDALKQGRYAITISLTSAMIDDCGSDYTRLVMTVNRWIARKRLQGLEAIRPEVEEWQTSALQPRFELAKLALLDKTDAAIALAKKLIDLGDLPVEAYRTWPLLAECRDQAPELAGPNAEQQEQAPSVGGSASPEAERPTPDDEAARPGAEGNNRSSGGGK